jgi:nucleotide-binding universal stress UspA family protein
MVVSEGRSVDLIVVSHDNRPNGELDIILAALHQTGRPVLLVPRQGVKPVRGYPQSVMVAWDGSLPAARALRDGIPHMLHANKVFLLRIEDSNSAQLNAQEADVITYLSSHGVDAEVVRVPRLNGRLGPLMIGQAKRLNAELLIMGAYGPGHLTEMLLGGTTDYVVKHAQIPLLLAR